MWAEQISLHLRPVRHEGRTLAGNALARVLTSRYGVDLKSQVLNGEALVDELLE